MSEEQTEQKFGLEGIEQAQGYQPMVLQSDLNAQVEQYEQDLDTATREFVESRPDSPPPTERAFVGPDGNPTPENHTLSAEEAAKELAATRQSELGALEEFRKSEIAAAADALRGIEQEPEPAPAADAPVEAQPQQPVAAGAEGHEQPQQPQGTSWGERLANDPEMLSAVSGWANQVQAEVQQHTQAATATAANYIAQAANLAALALFNDTELAGVPAEGIEGALKMLSRTNPGRAEQLVNKIQNLQALQARAQVAQAEQAQIQKRQLQSWGLEQDRIFDAALPKLLPGVDVAKVSAHAKQTLRDAGIDDDTMRRLWNESEIFRSSSAQILMAKAAAWDVYQKDLVAAKAAMKNQRNNPIAHVVKPGVSNSFARGYEEATRMPSEFSSPKQAAEWLTARRGRSAR
jgi:hypothetical protein